MPKRIIKYTQLWLHRNYSWVQGGLFIALGCILLLSSVIMLATQNRLISKTNELARQNQRLSQENQDLARGTQDVVKQNRLYTKCIATIFAQYTHDFVPITIVNLDECVLDSHAQQPNEAPVAVLPPSSSATPASSSPSPSTTSATPSPTPEPTPPPETPTQQLDDVVNGIIKSVTGLRL